MTGPEIVAAVMAERGLGKWDFFTSRLDMHVKARRIAIKRLAAAGFNAAEISRFMHCDHATARYWMSPERRKQKRAAMVAWYARKKQEQNHASA